MKNIVASYLMTSLFCLAIAALLWVLSGRTGFLESASVSLCIGLSIQTSFLMIGSRLEQMMPRYLAAIPNVVIGFTTGLLLGGILIRGNLMFYFDDESSTVVLAVFFGVIGYVIFRGRVRLIDLRAQVAEQALAKKQQEKEFLASQLKLLQAQIEPHFLFNTLSNVVGMIHANPAGAENTLINLTKLLRSTLERTRDGESTINDEVTLLRAYLDIQKTRMQDRLSYSINVQSECELLTLAPLLLQPLVENAIIHGIEPAESGGEVVINILFEEDELVMQVIDNGVGIVEQGPSTSIGLENVRKRLETLYDNAAHLYLKTNHPHGVIAELRLPADQK